MIKPRSFQPTNRLEQPVRCSALLILLIFFLSTLGACSSGTSQVTATTIQTPTTGSVPQSPPTATGVPYITATTSTTTSTPGATSAAPPPPLPGSPTALPTQRPTPKGAQTLTLAVGSNTPTFDPALVRDGNSSFLVRQLFRGLVSLDANLNVVPDLAERVELSADGRTYTFTLRSNAVFHDGKVIDAAAVRYSLERATDPRLAGNSGAQLPGATYLGDIAGAQDKLDGRATTLAGVQVLNARTLTISLDQPKAYFLMKLSYPVSAVVDEANISRGGANWTRTANGSGPFRLDRFTADQLILKRFDRFYAGAPVLEQVTILYGQAAAAPMNLYEGNKIDYTAVPLSSVDRVLVANSPLHAELVITPSLSLTYVGFNVTSPPYDDRNFRRALVQAINRERLVTVSQEGKAVLATGVVPPTMPGGPWQGQPLPYNLNAARADLASSRYSKTAVLPPPAIYAASGGLAVTMRKVYQRDLNLDLEAVSVDWPEYLEGLSARTYPAFEITWVADYPDPENFLAVLFRTGSGENHTGYSNPEVDRLLAGAAAERDPTQRRQYYLSAQQIILDDAVILPAYHAINYTLIKPWVKGLNVTPLGVVDLATVWIER